MSSNITVSIPKDITLLAGPQLIGLFISWGLLGVLSTQIYIYRLCFPRDPKGIKFLVYGLFAMEITQTCMLSSDSFHWLVDGWGHFDILENYYMSWFDVPIMVPMISCTVHSFFAWRIYILSKSFVLSAVILALSLTQATAGIVSGIQLRFLPSFVEVGQLFIGVSIWHIGSALVDVLIAVSMTYLLVARSKDSLNDTKDVISRLIRLVVETGVLTASVSIVDVVLFNVFKHNNLHMCPAIILAKLYTNTMMAIFNNRIFASQGSPVVRFRKDESSSSSGVLTSVEFGPSDFHNGTTSSWRLRDALSGAAGTHGQVTALSVSLSFQDTFRRADENCNHINSRIAGSGATTTSDEDELATPITEVHLGKKEKECLAV